MKDQIHQELAALQEELARLASAVKQIEAAKEVAVSSAQHGKELHQKYNEQLIEIRRMTDQYQELVLQTQMLIKRIETVNFPERLDKIDASIVNIVGGHQLVQQKLENANRDVKDQFAESRSASSSQAEAMEKQLGRLMVLLISVLMIGLVSLAVAFFK